MRNQWREKKAFEGDFLKHENVSSFGKKIHQWRHLYEEYWVREWRDGHKLKVTIELQNGMSEKSAQS